MWQNCIKFTTLTILCVQFSGVKCIHIAVLPLPLSIPRTSQTCISHPLNNNSHSPALSSWQLPFCFLFLLSLTVLGTSCQQTPTISIYFCNWLISLSIMSLKFIHIVVCVLILFLLRLNSISLYVPHFVYSFFH